MECLGIAALVGTLASGALAFVNTIQNMIFTRRKSVKLQHDIIEQEQPRKVVNVHKKVRKRSVSTYNNSKNRNSTKVETVNIFREPRARVHRKDKKKLQRNHSSDDILDLSNCSISDLNNIHTWTHKSNVD